MRVMRRNIRTQYTSVSSPFTSTILSTHNFIKRDLIYEALYIFQKKKRYFIIYKTLLFHFKLLNAREVNNFNLLYNDNFFSFMKLKYFLLRKLLIFIYE